jgi:lipid-A-disaccharide synthase
MLLERPMVVIYQMNKLTYKVVSRMLKVPYVSLPNILAGEAIVPELIQEQATAESICRTVTQLLQVRAYKAQQDALIATKVEMQAQSNQQPAHTVIEYWLAQQHR